MPDPVLGLLATHGYATGRTLVTSQAGEVGSNASSLQQYATNAFIDCAMVTTP